MKLSGGSFADLKAALARRVDHEAEACRAQFITLGAGQALVYEQKLREANEISANTYYDAELGENVTTVQPAEVPNLAVEAADLNVSLIGAASAVLTAAYQWAQLSSLIESKRLTAKRAIADAATPEAARLAAVVSWDLGF